MSGNDTIVIRGREYTAVCEGKPEHPQGEAKLVALVDAKGKTIWSVA